MKDGIEQLIDYIVANIREATQEVRSVRQVTRKFNKRYTVLRKASAKHGGA